MMAFELLEPGSLKEAIALIDPDDPEVRPIAGGTALMLMMKAGVFRPRRLVSLRKLGEAFSRIAAAPAGDLTIGAMAPLSALEHSPAVVRGAPVIVRTMRRLSNVRVRNVATVGGALAHADPHMDLPPVLIALGATIAVSGPAGERTMAIEDLFTGYYETALAQERIDHSIAYPGARRNPRSLLQSHLRLRRRLALARRCRRAAFRRQDRQVCPHCRQCSNRQGDAPESRGSGADRRRCRRQDCLKR